MISFMKYNKELFQKTLAHEQEAFRYPARYVKVLMDWWQTTRSIASHYGVIL